MWVNSNRNMLKTNLGRLQYGIKNNEIISQSFLTDLIKERLNVDAGYLKPFTQSDIKFDFKDISDNGLISLLENSVDDDLNVKVFAEYLSRVRDFDKYEAKAIVAAIIVPRSQTLMKLFDAILDKTTDKTIIGQIKKKFVEGKQSKSTKGRFINRLYEPMKLDTLAPPDGYWCWVPVVRSDRSRPPVENKRSPRHSGVAIYFGRSYKHVSNAHRNETIEGFTFPNSEYLYDINPNISALDVMEVIVSLL